jgi:hypothetical protein
MSTIEELATNQAPEGIPHSAGSAVSYCEHCGNPFIAVPALQTVEGRTLVQLRCFARRASSGCYVAECIDLDIAAEAPTLKGAIAGLQDAMRGYLLLALDGPDTNGIRDVIRPSPLSHRIRYHFEYLKGWVSARLLPSDARSTPRFFQFPLFSRSHCGI